jgi:hypothetical protein
MKRRNKGDTGDKADKGPESMEEHSEEQVILLRKALKTWHDAASY